MHSVRGPSAPRAAAPRGGLAAAEASTAVVAKAARCASRLTAAALGALVPPNQPSRQGCVGRVCRRPGDNTLQPPARHFDTGAAVTLLDGADKVFSDVAVGRLCEVDWVPLLPDANPTGADQV